MFRSENHDLGKRNSYDYQPKKILVIGLVEDCNPSVVAKRKRKSLVSLSGTEAIVGAFLMSFIGPMMNLK